MIIVAKGTPLRPTTGMSSFVRNLRNALRELPLPMIRAFEHVVSWSGSGDIGTLPDRTRSASTFGVLERERLM